MALASSTSITTAVPALGNGLELLEAKVAASGASRGPPLPSCSPGTLPGGRHPLRGARPYPTPAALLGPPFPFSPLSRPGEASMATTGYRHGSRAGRRTETLRPADGRLLSPPPARRVPPHPTAALPSHTHRGGSFLPGDEAPVRPVESLEAPAAADPARRGGGTGRGGSAGRGRARAGRRGRSSAAAAPGGRDAAPPAGLRERGRG